MYMVIQPHFKDCEVKGRHHAQEQFPAHPNCLHNASCAAQIQLPCLFTSDKSVNFLNSLMLLSRWPSQEEKGNLVWVLDYLWRPLTWMRPSSGSKNWSSGCQWSRKEFCDADPCRRRHSFWRGFEPCPWHQDWLPPARTCPGWLSNGAAKHWDSGPTREGHDQGVWRGRQCPATLWKIISRSIMQYQYERRTHSA